MKHWQESRQVYAAWTLAQAAGRRAAFATVVRVDGSAYRRPGARMLVDDTGETHGHVSAGCLEGDVREVAQQVIASGVPQLRRYASSSDTVRAWDLGIGCDGEVLVYVEPAHDVDGERRLLDGREAFVVARPLAGTADPRGRLIVTAAVHHGDRDIPPAMQPLADEMRRLVAAREAPQIVSWNGTDVFADVFLPPPDLVIIGAGDDALPLATLADMAGFRITVVDRRPALLRPVRFPAGALLAALPPPELDVALQEGRIDAVHEASFVVIMTHQFADDLAYLRAVVATEVPYLGILGPALRTRRLLDDAGITNTAAEARVHGPVGLDLGGEGAEHIALAIVTELLAIHHARGATMSSRRTSVVHA